jgi:mono/diheme cytochrome c family protein
VIRNLIVGFVALVLVVVGLFGLRGGFSRKPPLEVFPDMDRQHKLRPMEPNSFFANGLSSQLPVAGTVSRSRPLELADGARVYRFENHSAITGGTVNQDGTNYLVTLPIKVDAAVLARGRGRYNITCAICHGRAGDGQGVVSLLGVGLSAANLHGGNIIGMPDGQLYRTIVHGSKEGKGQMKGYGPELNVADRWAVVAYVRALQYSRLVARDELKMYGKNPDDIPAFE